jgi:hypothetical protein
MGESTMAGRNRNPIAQLLVGTGTQTRRISLNWGSGNGPGSAVAVRMKSQGLRDALGKYAEREQQSIAEARRINEALAREMQQNVIEIVSSFNRRPSTGRLEKAMRDERNVFVADNGQSWGFGNPEILNKSVARYWRTIDEGSAATFKSGGFAGTEIWPMLFPNRHPALSKYLAWYTNVTPDNLFAGKAGAPRPRGKIRAVPEATGREWEALFGRFGYGPIVVKNEIQPHNYFRQALSQMLPQIQTLQFIRRPLDIAWKKPGV